MPKLLSSSSLSKSAALRHSVGPRGTLYSQCLSTPSAEEQAVYAQADLPTPILRRLRAQLRFHNKAGNLVTFDKETTSWAKWTPLIVIKTALQRTSLHPAGLHGMTLFSPCVHKHLTPTGPSRKPRCSSRVARSTVAPITLSNCDFINQVHVKLWVLKKTGNEDEESDISDGAMELSDLVTPPSSQTSILSLATSKSANKVSAYLGKQPSSSPPLTQSSSSRPGTIWPRPRPLLTDESRGSFCPEMADYRRVSGKPTTILRLTDFLTSDSDLELMEQLSEGYLRGDFATQGQVPHQMVPYHLDLSNRTFENLRYFDMPTGYALQELNSTAGVPKATYTLLSAASLNCSGCNCEFSKDGFDEQLDDKLRCTNSPLLRSPNVTIRSTQPSLNASNCTTHISAAPSLSGTHELAFPKTSGVSFSPPASTAIPVTS
ncbi:hypothetical protein DXG01_001095 [Tephrocybe rancida]|nr:hypothetical protein DXG01_001095 [Tephrocybe rancida]